MTRTTTSTARRLALAGCLLASALLPAQAQRTTSPQTDPYNAPVDPLPPGCTFIRHHIDGAPRVRPVAVQISRFVDPAPVAVALPRIDPSPLVRQVAFSYTFSNLSMKLVGDVAGVFRVNSERTTVFMGPTVDHPVASDRTLVGVNSVTWSSSAQESRASLSVPFNTTWLVRHISEGIWTSDAVSPPFPTWVRFDCTVTVRPLATTVGP